MLNKEKLNANKTIKSDCRGGRLCPPANKQKGITLIALIITIIVMLILVGVTINVALNGNLFGKAETATKQTQKEADKEALLSAAVGTIKTDGTVDFEVLDENLPTGWTGTNGTYTSPKGNKFTVDANGKITEGEKENTPPTPVLPEGLTVGSEFEMDADQDGTEETWIVLYDGTASHLNENEIEVISKNTMGEDLELGKNDTEAIENATDIDGNGTVEEIEIAIYSYNNAIDRINNYCKDLIKISNLGVRSVGSLPSDPSYRNTSKPYAIQYLDRWTNKTGWNTYGVLGENTDTNSDDDYKQMDTLGIKASGDAKEYWLASREVCEDWYDSSSRGGVGFGVGYVNTSGEIIGTYLWYVPSRSSAYANGNPAYAGRPVVKLLYP